MESWDEEQTRELDQGDQPVNTPPRRFRPNPDRRRRKVGKFFKMYFNHRTNKYERVIYSRPHSLSRKSPNPSAVTDFVTIYQSNTRGIKSKKQSLQLIANSVKPDIMLLSETLLKPSEKPKLKGYASFFKSRETKQGGGLITAVSESVSHGVVQVYSGLHEILVTRTEFTRKTLTIISVYGKQEQKKEIVQEEFDEICSQMTQAKVRGDLCMVVGDMNRHVGDIIPGNDDRVSFGGSLWRDLLSVGEFHLLNAAQDKVRGGPFTWFRPGGGARSALSLWIVCSDTLPHVELLTIDDLKDITPFRVKGRKDNRTQIYSDHVGTMVKLVNLDKIPNRHKTTSWSFKGPGVWEKYKEESQHTGTRLSRKLEAIDDLEKADKLFEKEMKALYYKCFKRITTKSPGPEKNVQIIDNKEKIEKVAQMNKEAFEKEIEMIKANGATVGKIYALKEIVHGRKRNQKQVPAAVQDPVIGEMVYTAGEIKETTVTTRDHKILLRSIGQFSELEHGDNRGDGAAQRASLALCGDRDEITGVSR